MAGSKRTRGRMVVAVACLAAGAIAMAVRERTGYGRLFDDPTYHHQALRALNHAAAFGADISEVLQASAHVRAGDAEGWFAAWSELGDRNLERAGALGDPLDRGRALLRAHTYFLRSTFFLPAEDPRRTSSSRRDRAAFYAALDALGVAVEPIPVPYGHAHLNALLYRPVGPPRSTLIVFCGGSDTTLEELYFFLGAAARERGYAVLTFEGPGQGSVAREQGLYMTPEWEKPTSRVLDTYLAAHARPEHIVMVGLSLGGYLAMRAAAFDDRIEGVVAYDVFYDGREVAGRNVPPLAVPLRHLGLDPVLNRLAQLRARWDTASAAAMVVGESMLGRLEPLEWVDALARYTLDDDVAGRVRQDVLLFAGEEDQFVPIEQVEKLQRALHHARSVTTHVYDRASGGAEHSQLGATSLWQADLFAWLEER